MSEKQSYYKENLPLVIQRLKGSVDKLLPIIDKDIDAELTDDKLFNVLKAKRQATEDALWTFKRIDELENELNGTTPEQEAETVTLNWTKRNANKK